MMRWASCGPRGEAQYRGGVPYRPRCLVLTLAAATALLGACSDDEPTSSERTATTAETSDATASTTSEAEPVETTTTQAEAAAQIVLRGDGLGVTALGAAPEEAVAAVTAALGEPTRDTGWQASFSEYGTCPGEQIRGVEWDHLVLLFTDADTTYGTGQHLFSWRITGAPPALGTSAGLGFGATTADAEELHPGAVEVFPAEEPFPGHLRVGVEGGAITAYLDADTITNLEAGAPCGE